MPNRSEPQVITPQLLRDWPLPVPEGGKDARGTVLVIGGSRSTPGAVLLAGVAALRAGAGVLQLAVTESTAAILSIQVPEALVIGVPETGGGSMAGTPPDQLLELVADARVVLVGPGLDSVAGTSTLLRHVLDAANPQTAFVLDAYALGALSQTPQLLVNRPQPVVLTPNHTEARYLSGAENDQDPAATASALARQYDAVVSLFGEVAAPDGRAWSEQSGDIGLGTSGSGDVLAGIVAGLLSRGADPAQAACWGAYAHAMSGLRLIPRYGRIGFLARDLLDEVPRTLAIP